MTSTDDTYNGWTNRETWAVALYIDNDQGWQESVFEALRSAQADDTDHELSTNLAAKIVRENVEQTITVEGYIENFGGDHLPRELSVIAEDIGSLYRVNWDELGANFLTDLADVDG